MSVITNQTDTGKKIAEGGYDLHEGRISLGSYYNTGPMPVVILLVFILAFGIGDYFYLKLNIYKGSGHVGNKIIDGFKQNLDLLLVSFFLENLALGLLLLVQQKSKRAKSMIFATSINEPFFRIRRILFFIGISLIMIALTSITISLTNNIPTLYFIVNEIYLLLCGILLTLSTYLGSSGIVHDLNFDLQKLEMQVMKAAMVVEKKDDVSSNYNQIKPTTIDQIQPPIIPYKYQEFVEFTKTIDSADAKVEYRIQNLITRLNGQNLAIQKQANVNLIIGVTTALGGVLALMIIIYSTPTTSLESIGSKFNYVSRLSVVVFIEVLALFFLRLYKENLNDKKYYQNELTNVEMKYLALASAKPADISRVIDQLLATERNFKLSKNESTVSLKHIELENSLMESTFSKLEALIGKLKSK